jgi:prepilin-type N-terminal cleavage/methylation domain-containing protein
VGSNPTPTATVKFELGTIFLLKPSCCTVLGVPLRRFFYRLLFRMGLKEAPKRRGFTLIEILLVISIIATLFSIVFGAAGGWLFNAREARAKVELSEIKKATQMMVIDLGGSWPPDVSRGMPPGIEQYLGPGNWPDAPFSDVAEYDWDNFTGSDGKPVYQISIRFCPLGKPAECKFPDVEWAQNFDYFSSYYFCIQGKCRAHPGKPDNHPGYCVNC